MVLNPTFNNISVISWRSVLLVEETEVLGENHRPVASTNVNGELHHMTLYRGQYLSWLVFLFIYRQNVYRLLFSEIAESKSTQLSLEVGADKAMYIDMPSSVCLNLHITITIHVNLQ